LDPGILILDIVADLDSGSGIRYLVLVYSLDTGSGIRFGMNFFWFPNHGSRILDPKGMFLGEIFLQIIVILIFKKLTLLLKPKGVRKKLVLCFMPLCMYSRFWDP
jgi:hypothetical protein